MRNVPNKISPSGDAAKAVEEYLAVPDIHATRREKNGGLVALTAGAIVTPLEFYVLHGIVTGGISPMTGLLLHMFVTVALAIGAVVLRRGAEARFALLLLLGVITTGPFGSAGVVLTVITYLWCTRRALAFDEWFDSIFPKQLQMASQRIYDDIVIGRDESSVPYSVISFMDVLSFGSEVQKRQALARATAQFHPNFAPMFRKALADHSNTIRVMAATGISKVESIFLRRLMQLTELKEQNPKDHLVTWALAEHYDNYAYTGLLDYDREQINREKAMQYYNEYLQMQPQDIEPRNRIGRILMREKQYEKACDWFRQCITAGYASDSISLWYSEALFASGRYEDLRIFCVNLSPVSVQNATSSTAMREAIALWSGNRMSGNKV